MFISILLNAVMIKDGWGERISELEMKRENVQTETRGKESREHQGRYYPHKSDAPHTSSLPPGKKGLKQMLESKVAAVGRAGTQVSWSNF